MKKEKPDTDPTVRHYFQELYKRYEVLRPWMLKMGIRANRLPQMDYLGPLLHKFTLKRLDQTNKIIDKFESGPFANWMKIRKENTESVWDFHEVMAPDNDHLAEVIALKEASKKCAEFWFANEENVFVKDKKKGKEDDREGDGESTSGVREEN